MANWSGLWDRQYGVPYVQLGAQITQNENSAEISSTNRLRIARTLRARGNRPFARLMYALVGVAAGATATESATRVPAVQGVGDPMSNGGQRVPASVTLVNRITTAADITLMQQTLTQVFGPVVNSGYARDAAGNGGGGKLGTF